MEQTVLREDAAAGAARGGGLPLLHILWFAALLALCYWPVIGNVTHQWRVSDDMVHGLFVPPVAAYIAWERRAEWMAAPVRRCGWGLFLIVWGAVQACLGALGAEIFTERVAMMFSIYGIVLYFAGWRVFRTLLFPLMLLWFMLPVPGIVYKQITFPLQLSSGHGWMRWALLASAIPVAVAANAARVMATGILGEHDPRLAEGFFHGFSGWVIFVFAIVTLMAIERLLSWIGAGKAGAR
jgi:exosortase/archaeosortase family protein